LTGINTILIIRFSSIGDIVLTTPVIRALRSKYPDARIDYLTKKEFQPVLQGNPHITRILTINKHVNEVLPGLKAENYDFIVDLHKNYRSYMVRYGLKKPCGSFDKLNINKWLLVNFKIRRMPDLHIVDRYFQAVGKLGVSNDNQGLDFYIPEEEKLGQNDLPLLHRNGFIAFVVGGKHQTKMLPAEKVISICRKLDKPVMLLGGKEDHAAGVKIQRAAGDKVFNACGLYSINQSASVLQQAEKVITNDTGLMHIAAAFNKPVISVWGNTVPEFGMYPYMPRHPERSTIMEVKELSCRPCSKIGYSKCPKRHFKCMMDIPEEGIVEKLTL
jgi:lipopolysaccharide heptosyltransferase II